jgi:hypothetical protein
VQGGCYKAANEYYNLMLDLGDRATLEDAVKCEVRSCLFCLFFCRV